MVLPNKATSSRTIPLYIHYAMNNCIRHTHLSLSPKNNDFLVILSESTKIHRMKGLFMFVSSDIYAQFYENKSSYFSQHEGTKHDYRTFLINVLYTHFKHIQNKNSNILNTAFAIYKLLSLLKYLTPSLSDPLIASIQNR